jgi:hypothetical protein
VRARKHEPAEPGSPVQAALADAGDAQTRNQHDRTQAWLTTLPDKPRIVDGIVTNTSERDFARFLIDTFDATLAETA